MKTSLILKINFLILGLLLVLFAIRSLNQGGLPTTMAEFLAPPLSGSKKIYWCETRVKSIIKPEGFQLEQQGMKWFSIDGSNRELDFITVEKWFGRHCAIIGEDVVVDEAELAGFKPVIFVKFIDDKVEALGRNDGGTFIWRGRAFRSAGFDQALTELAQIVGFSGQD